MAAEAPATRRGGRSALSRALLDDMFASLRLSTPSETTIRTSATQSLGYDPQPTVIKYYSPDPAWTTGTLHRISGLAALIRWPVTNDEFEFDTVPTWIYSCIDFAFPGLSATILSSDPNVSVENLILTSELLASKRPGGVSTEEQAEVLPGLVVDAACQSAEWLHCVGALTTLIFTLGKSPSEKNLPAFTVNRPKAIADKMGVTIDQTSPLAGARLPALEHFRQFGGYFNMNYTQRRTMVRTLLSWTGRPNLTADQTVVVTQIALWKNSGMTHLLMVRDFMQNFGQAVLLINGLKSEATAFMNAWTMYIESTDTEKDYLRVIDGDRAQLGRSRDYISLLNLARSVASVVDSRFKQYAPSLGESPFKTEFISKCRELGYSLPAKYIEDVDEDAVTGGGVVRAH